MEFNHYSVMLDETISELCIKPDGIYVDGTLGGGGHAFQVCKRLTTGHFYGIDQDDAAIAAAGERLSCYGDMVTIIRSNYCNAKAALAELGVKGVDGIVLDLGVSSYQLDTEERGFSYRNGAAPLDMRMDQTAALTAETVVNTYSEERLAQILKTYGEETFAKQIARNVVKYRADKPLKTSGELSEIIQKSIPAKFRYGAPCERKTFQALRIEVNGELDGLSELVTGLTRRLKKGGRIVILTFQSLEDRIVKEAFKKMESPCTCPGNFPVCVCGKKPEIKIITKKPITASENELCDNSRSKCAKLRIAEKL